MRPLRPSSSMRSRSRSTRPMPTTRRASRSRISRRPSRIAAVRARAETCTFCCEAEAARANGRVQRVFWTWGHAERIRGSCLQTQQGRGQHHGRYRVRSTFDSKVRPTSAVRDHAANDCETGWNDSRRSRTAFTAPRYSMARDRLPAELLAREREHIQPAWREEAVREKWRRLRDLLGANASRQWYLYVLPKSNQVPILQRRVPVAPLQSILSVERLPRPTLPSERRRADSKQRLRENVGGHQPWCGVRNVLSRCVERGLQHFPCPAASRSGRMCVCTSSLSCPFLFASAAACASSSLYGPHPRHTNETSVDQHV